MVGVVRLECGGAKSSYAVSCGDRGGETGVRACKFCKGEGQVSSEAADRWHGAKRCACTRPGLHTTAGGRAARYQSDGAQRYRTWPPFFR
jgi:hypothetical protein